MPAANRFVREFAALLDPKRMTPRILSRLLSLITLSACLSVSAPTWGDEADAYFLSAREAFQQGDAERLNRVASFLQGHVLWPYVAWWQFRAEAQERTPEQWLQFIAGQPESLITQRARAELIRALAVREDWEGVEREFAAFELDDPDVRCIATQARLARKQAEAEAEAVRMWAQPTFQGEGCTALFESLIRTGRLSESEVWIRIRALLEANNATAARHLFNYLPARARPAKRQWDAVTGNPTRYLQGKALPLKTRTDRELAVFALYRTALSVPELAAERWQSIRKRFPAAERDYGWAQLGAAGAFKHRPEALTWFAEAGDLPLSERQTAWKVRAGIRAQDYAVIARTIDGMPPADQQIATWRFWRARAYRQEGKTLEANQLLAPLSTETSFYGQIAAEELGAALSEVALPVTLADEESINVAQHAGLRRALKLYEMDLRHEAVLEWRWSIRRLDDRQLLAAAQLAQRAGWFDRTIDTAERTRQVHDFTLRYPLPHRDVFTAYSQRHGVDEAWVYGLVRQESRFIQHVRSSAGAMGLMQLMPSTAREVARRAGLGQIDRGTITTVDTNVSLGTYHLRELLDMLDDKPVLASAAYNAGLSRVRAWQPASAMEGVVFAETIPFSETRDYVKKVMSNTMYYARVLGQPFVALKARLGTIAGRLQGN